MKPDEVILLKKVSKQFGDFAALVQVDLRVQRGGFLLLAGANGSGKTTLLRLLAGLCRPSDGQVLVDGAEPHQTPAARAACGLISHHPLLYEDLTASENLLFFARLYHLTDREERVAQTLAQVGLEARQHHRVRTFSRGMKQRLALARAILHRPTVLLLDEPFTGLDQRAARILSGHLRRFKEQGGTAILVTHHLQEALPLMDQLVILRRGRICHDAPWKGGDGAGLSALCERYLEERL